MSILNLYNGIDCNFFQITDSFFTQIFDVTNLVLDHKLTNRISLRYCRQHRYFILTENLSLKGCCFTAHLNVTISHQLSTKCNG